MGSRLLLVLSTCLLLAGASACRSPQPPAEWSFGIIGDLPYAPVEEPQFENLIDAMNREDLAFVIHVGDLKGQNDPCGDDIYHRRLEQFNRFSHPFIFVPGDNEWTDCHKPETPSDPLERLAFLRKVLYPSDRTLGQTPFELERQSSSPAFASFRENSRWSRSGVLFATLHVVGSNDGFGRWPEGDREHAQRGAANRAWMEAAFRLAAQDRYRALMLVIHGNPRFDRPPGDPGRSGFEDFLGSLEAETLAFSKPVVLVHGDTHYFRIDKPLRNTQTRRRIVHLTRVESFGVPDVHWVAGDGSGSQPQRLRLRSGAAAGRSGEAMTAADIGYASLRQQAEWVRTRALSPVEILEAHLQRVQSINPSLKAVVTLADGSRERARQAEAA